MRRTLPPLVSLLLLVACVDTTGLSADSSKPPHPKSSPNAAVTVVEYADLQCPACRAAHTVIVQPLLEQHGSRIRYEFKNFPLRSIHRYALQAAEGAECAADQKKFWEFVDLAFEHQEDLNEDAIFTWGEQLDLDMDPFTRCVKSKIKRDAILAEYDEGQKNGVTGTPTFFVNGQRVESTLEAITAAINTATANVRNRL